ncbi:MAG: hypothetical protein NT062_04035 [Proteobacteria bacterium]|nr:hypothetical protein [Pseudomonadota bacterium]
MKAWAQRAVELHRELAEVAEVGRVDPRWWLVAAGAAVVEPWPARGTYLISDAEPGADTFMGYAATVDDPVRDAIARAHAARVALRALDGTLPEQPLAITVERTRDGGAIAHPSTLARVAFAIGARVIVVTLHANISEEGPLATRLARELDDHALSAGGREDDTPEAEAPFVTITLGDEPRAFARHGHRRAWTGAGGPWLGLGHADGLATISTCHLAVDGYGHARLTSAIAEAHAALYPTAPTSHHHRPVPVPSDVGGPELRATPLGIAWRPIPHGLRALPLGFALGRVLHAHAGRPDARFSPTFQIPVAPGRRDDPMRLRRRVVFAVSSVRFTDGAPEPYAQFAARTRELLAREAMGEGLCGRMLAAARAMPAPLAWKRRQFSAHRPRWLDRISDVLGGRACLSRMSLDGAPGPALCAVSSPSRFATRGDPLGACVVTIVDHPDGAATITACGSGLAGTDAAAETLLDDLLAMAATAS